MYRADIKTYLVKKDFVSFFEQYSTRCTVATVVRRLPRFDPLNVPRPREDPWTRPDLVKSCHDLSCIGQLEISMTLSFITPISCYLWGISNYMTNLRIYCIPGRHLDHL